MKVKILIIFVSALCIFFGTWTTERSAWAEDYVDAYHDALKPLAVTENKELMKILFNPIFEELKAAVAKQPETRKEWQDLYVATYSLAEVTNLLFSRDDKEYMQAEEWSVMSEISRRVATELGDAIKTQDYKEIRERYLDVVDACNICHERNNPDDPTKISAFGPSATEKKKKNTKKSTDSKISE